jgi:hypothetical protein
VIPLAHLGHVLIDAPVFLGPMFLVIGWIWLDGRRRARQRPNAANGAPHASRDGDGGGTL